MMYFIKLFAVCSFLVFVEVITDHQKPNIILIIGDDLGWNDVGFHGSDEIPTPNIDALAYNGLILNRHYTQSTCTPSRSALMTGKYPIKLGTQGYPIIDGMPISVPLKEKLMPEYLKELGYVTRLVGKWHLGFYTNKCTPTKRGFDSFLGYYNGMVRYNDSVSGRMDVSGIDAWHNFNHAGDRFYNKYNTDVYTEEAVSIIHDHNKSKPLFLEVAYTAVHSIPTEVLQVRNITENNIKFGYIHDPYRRLFAGVLNALDESVGKVIEALDKKDMLRNSIVAFIGDNGAAVEDNTKFFGKNYGSNWPLRGGKSSLTDGGVRGVAAIWSPFIRRQEVLHNLMHLVDWLPTFYEAAGGNVSKMPNIDGVSHWNYFNKLNSQSPRKQLLLNINERTEDAAIIKGKWKFIKNTKGPTVYYNYKGRSADLKYNLTKILKTPSQSILSKYVKYPLNEYVIQLLRQKSKIDDKCKERIDAKKDILNTTLDCFLTGCLFDIIGDPCEFVDVSANHSDIIQKLNVTLTEYRSQLVKQPNCAIDEKSNPKYFDNYWTPWITTEPTTCSNDEKILFNIFSYHKKHISSMQNFHKHKNITK